jgi:cobalamin synthase
MNKHLKKTVLDSRQFIGLLLAAFSVASLAIAVALAAIPPDASIEGILSRSQAEGRMMDGFGFVLPPLQSFVVPLLAVTAVLAAVNLWLLIRGRLGTA